MAVDFGWAGVFYTCVLCLALTHSRYDKPVCGSIYALVCVAEHTAYENHSLGACLPVPAVHR